MNVTCAGQCVEFRPWWPDLERVFAAGSAVAFDCETTPIDEAQPWLTPDYVLGAAYDGQRGFFIQRAHVANFFALHRDIHLVMHRAPFDLAVIHKLAPELDVYGWVEANQVWDTLLLWRLHALATAGHPAQGEASLEDCAREYLGLTLPKDVTDSTGHLVRTSWGRWLDRPPQEIDRCYLEYLARDAWATRLLFQQLWTRIDGALAANTDAFGYVSREWLAAQVHLWGPQTHHIQLRAAIVLRTVSAAGLHVDQERCRALCDAAQAACQRALAVLSQFGWQPGAGSGERLQQILAEVQARHPEVALPRTKSGQFTASAKELCRLGLDEPFITAFADYGLAKKRLELLEKMKRAELHPRFDLLKVTGRTSSSGDLNAQNVPRDAQVRSCFVPTPGHVFVIADYKAVELVTLAQACRTQFGWQSQMAAALNAGQDLHAIVAAKVTGKPLDRVTSEERQRAKAINFGKPGGMGDPALQRLAADSYGVQLNATEVQALSEAWYELFPEMRAFLKEEGATPGLLVATTLGLTPRAHFQHTRNQCFFLQADIHGLADQPKDTLGWMALKAFAQRELVSGGGRAYPPEIIDFFWTRLLNVLELLPAEHHEAVRTRQPSPALRQAVNRATTQRGVFTLTGRLRANASYTERHNTVFQGLAADGAKLALWALWRAGYRIVDFVHDEVLVEVPRDADLAQHTTRIRELLVSGMREVVPDVAVAVALFPGDSWCKGAPPKPVRHA